jgi:transposase-like protein
MTPTEEAHQRLEAATQEAFPNYPQRKPKAPQPRTGRKPVINYDAVRELTEQHHTAEQIAHKLGCSTSAVNLIRHRLGITSPRLLTPEKRALIEAAIQDGWSQAEICRTHHVDPETMRRHYPQAKWDRQQQNEHIRTLRTATRFNWGHHKPEANAA